MPSACRHVSAHPSPKFGLSEANASTRHDLEQFIARRFSEAYGARLYHFMPQLFGLHAPSGELIAAFGLRAASHQTLFLEHYLDAPIETCVAERYGRRVSRDRIVEVGNLAGATAGAVRELIVLLCERLHTDGFRWVTFTGSARLCNSFSRLGLPLCVMAPAPATRLCATERAQWGRYYDKSPSVMLGDIDAGRHQLQTNSTGSHQDHLLAPLALAATPS